MEKDDKWDKNHGDKFNSAVVGKEKIDFKLTPEAARRLKSIEVMKEKQLDLWFQKESRDTPKDVERRMVVLLQEHPTMKLVPRWARLTMRRSWNDLAQQARVDVAAGYERSRNSVREHADQERGRIIEYYRQQAKIVEAIERGDAGGKEPGLAPERPDLTPGLPGDAPDLTHAFNNPSDLSPPAGGDIER